MVGTKEAPKDGKSQGLLLRILGLLLRILGILLRVRRILARLLAKRTLPCRLADGLPNGLCPQTGPRLHAGLAHAKRIF